jgi:hypothetical protein
VHHWCQHHRQQIAPGVNYTSVKFATIINDTSGKFATDTASVFGACGKFAPVSTTAAENLPLVSMTPLGQISTSINDTRRQIMGTIAD